MNILLTVILGLLLTIGIYGGPKDCIAACQRSIYRRS